MTDPTPRPQAPTLVEQHAEDEGLWFIAATAPEAYLQQALRALHGAVEADHATLLALRQRLDERDQEIAQRDAARERMHAKFGYVKGEDDACACAYCVGDTEALAEACAEYEMQNFHLQQKLEQQARGETRRAFEAGFRAGTDGHMYSDTAWRAYLTSRASKPKEPTP